VTINTAAAARHSPYQGLIPYGEADAPFFFGREKETRLIIANMFASPLTLLYGASGVGKSSALRAGVARQLRQRDDLIVVPFSTWQSNSVAGLVQTIADYARRAEPAAGMDSTEPGLSTQSLPGSLKACHKKMGRRLMIILDQFEEYFLYHPQEDRFAHEFPQAVLQTDVPVSFLISIREDSLAKLDRFEGRIPSLFDNYLRVEHLDYDAARAAIEKPVEQYNKQRTAGEQPISIEPALLEAVLKQVQTGQVIIGETGRGILKTEADAAQIETPFLQMVMTRLWDEEMRAGSQVLRLSSLNALGGAERIVRTHLDETMSALLPERQKIAAEVFHYLVTPSGAKIAHTSLDLAEYVGLPRTQVAPALEELSSGNTRILRGIEPPTDQAGEPRYEIFHDVLAAAILDWRARYLQAREVAAQQLKLAAEHRRSKRLRLALLGVAALLLVVTGLTAWYRNLNNLSAEEAKKRSAATTLYLNGRNAWSRRTLEGINEAMGQFEEALKLDPNYARAYVGLADCYNLLATYGGKSPRETFPKAHDAAIKALAINNNLAEAHAALAYTSFRGDWNWPEAEREFKQAIQLDDTYISAHQWYSNYLVAQGRFDESIYELQRTHEIDKTSLIVYAHFGLVNYFGHRYDDSINECNKILELDPTFYVARRYLGLSYEQKGMYDEALSEFDKALVASGDSSQIKAEYVHTLALAGDTNKAQIELDALIALSKQEYVSAYHIASIYAGLKDNDHAFEWLEKAFQERADWMVFLKVEPRFDSLHSDPRFAELLRRMNLK